MSLTTRIKEIIHDVLLNYYVSDLKI